MDKSEREALAMLKSMTGFGRYENMTSKYKISVEMKAVNHRYPDLSIKIPKKFSYFEVSIRTLLEKCIQRGGVDLFINYEDYIEGNLCLEHSRALAAKYMDYFNGVTEEFDIQNDIKVPILAEFPEVFSMEQVPDGEEHLWKVLSVALEETAKMFAQSREAKGEHLKKDLLGRLDYITGLVDYIEKHSSQILGEYRIKLESKVQDLLSTTVTDEGRIAAEVTTFAGKICVGEGTVYLRSHIGNTKQELLSRRSIGHELNFITQKMNREANTILPKSTDLSISDRAIALRTETEKVREQIQGIEWADTIRTLKSQGSMP